MKVPFEVLKIADCCAKDTLRYSNNGVRFECTAEKCLATATDGRVLAEASWLPDADDIMGPVIVPAVTIELALAVCEAMAIDTPEPQCVIEPLTLTLRGAVIFQFTPLCGQWPDTAAVMSTKTEPTFEAPVDFWPSVLMTALKFAGHLGIERISLSQGKPYTPLHFRGANKETAISLRGCVMPLSKEQGA